MDINQIHNSRGALQLSFFFFFFYPTDPNIPYGTEQGPECLCKKFKKERELTSTGKTSHKHNNKDLHRLRHLVFTRIPGGVYVPYIYSYARWKLL